MINLDKVSLSDAQALPLVSSTAIGNPNEEKCLAENSIDTVKGGLKNLRASLVDQGCSQRQRA
ncbi:MAG TPA: hypothetical protein EYO33_08475 [Phycisphaerales bacterium]|nr:hypothetical protein [Phycisphaerales bacterium]